MPFLVPDAETTRRSQASRAHLLGLTPPNVLGVGTVWLPTEYYRASIHATATADMAEPPSQSAEPQLFISIGPTTSPASQPIPILVIIRPAPIPMLTATAISMLPVVTMGLVPGPTVLRGSLDALCVKASLGMTRLKINKHCTPNVFY